MAHTRELVHQARNAFVKLWPEESTGLFLDEDRQTETHNVVGSVQSLARHLNEFSPDDFKYLIFDEAHHATAETYQNILRYFRPAFTLGLTATPERADGLSALEVFRTTAHRLTLREAVDRGELVPIRCVRVQTNVDLSRVRFNQIQYNRRDIEESVLVPSRDRLIVETYREHVKGRKAVVFCVNVRHGEDLSERFREHQIRARSVSGRMTARERKECLDEFAQGNLHVLCACDLLNEGWDCPEVEVLFMARPTLSKVIYLQQLGRGTRKAPGKECLIVFDFVDNASRYNQSLSLHRVLALNRYRAGSLALASPDQLVKEAESLARNEAPTLVLPIELWARDYQEIDVFNWQDAISGMTSVADLEVELAAAEGRIKSAVERGVVMPDHSFKLGDRTYHYFLASRAEEIRQVLELPRVDDDSIRGLFLDFVARMDMSSSYKPVLLLAVFDHVDERGRARLDDVVRSFRSFYLARESEGLPVERPSMRMAQVSSLTEEDTRAIMLGMPFRKFEQRKYLAYDKQELSHIRIRSALWRQLSVDDLSSIRTACEEAIARYFERIAD